MTRGGDGGRLEAAAMEVTRGGGQSDAGTLDPIRLVDRANGKRERPSAVRVRSGLLPGSGCAPSLCIPDVSTPSFFNRKMRYPWASAVLGGSARTLRATSRRRANPWPCAPQGLDGGSAAVALRARRGGH